MIATIVIVTIAFIWLLIETEFFTVELMGLCRRGILTKMCDMMLGFIMLAVGLSMFDLYFEDEDLNLYDCYYKKYKSPLLHRVLKLYRKGRDIPEGLVEMADYQVRMYQRMDSEVEAYCPEVKL